MVCPSSSRHCCCSSSSWRSPPASTRWPAATRAATATTRSSRSRRARSPRRPSPSARSSRARSSRSSRRSPGIVKRCLVNVGDKVKAGDPLFEIAPDPTPQELTDVDRAARLDATPRIERAQADFERAQELVEGRASCRSPTSTQARGLRARQDRRRQGRAGARPDAQGPHRDRRASTMESIIRAPAAGTILTRAVNPGDPVVPLTSYQPGTELATIADMSDLIFKGTVDEIDVGKLHVGPAGAHQGRRAADRRRHRARSRASRRRRSRRKARRSSTSRSSSTRPRNDRRCAPATRPTPTSSSARRRTSSTIPERVVIFEDGGKKTFVELPGANAEGRRRRRSTVKLGISDGLNVEVVDGPRRRARRSSSGRRRR